MAFDKEAETDELPPRITVKFESGHPTANNGLPMPPMAYIAITRGSCDANENPMLTTRETSAEALEAQVQEIKAMLDGCVAELKARFAATTNR